MTNFYAIAYSVKPVGNYATPPLGKLIYLPGVENEPDKHMYRYIDIDPIMLSM